MDASPDIFNHNIETVPSLFPKARGGGDYNLSLGVLAAALEMNPLVITKSGLMLGLGETDSEIRIVMENLLSVGSQASYPWPVPEACQMAFAG